MIRTTQLTVLPEGGKIYALGVYTVTVDDEANGEYIVVEEQQDGGAGKICVDRETWPDLRDAIEQLIQETT